MIAPRGILSLIERGEELIDSHTDGVDLDELRAKYRGKLALFAKEVFGIDLWSAQAEVGQLTTHERLVYCVSANGVGKSLLAAVVLLFKLYVEGPGIVVVVAPTDRQVGHVMDQARQLWSFNARIRLPGEFFTRSLRVDMNQRWYALGFAGSGAGKITGLHAERLTVILDECHELESWAWEGITALMTGAENQALAIGNPGKPAGPWYQVCTGGRWVGRSVSALEHPNLTGDGPHIPGAVSQHFIDDIAATFGKTSGVYKSRVLGEFADGADEALYLRRWLNASSERWKAGVRDDDNPQPILAVDPARFGPDTTVVAVRRGSRLERLVSWHGLSTTDTVDRVVEVATEEGVMPRWQKGNARGRIIVDEVGVGGGVLDQLRKLKYRAQGFNGGHSPTESRKFLNLRGESYFRLRNALEDDEIHLPPDESLFEELMAHTWSVTPSGLVRLPPKETLSLGRSPDRADAVTMAFGFRNREVRVSRFAV